MNSSQGQERIEADIYCFPGRKICLLGGGVGRGL
jgi:hypothetical protein